MRKFAIYFLAVACFFCLTMFVVACDNTVKINLQNNLTDIEVSISPEENSVAKGTEITLTVTTKPNCSGDIVVTVNGSPIESSADNSVLTFTFVAKGNCDVVIDGTYSRTIKNIALADRTLFVGQDYKKSYNYVIATYEDTGETAEIKDFTLDIDTTAAAMNKSGTVTYKGKNYPIGYDVLNINEYIGLMIVKLTEKAGNIDSILIGNGAEYYYQSADEAKIKLNGEEKTYTVDAAFLASYATLGSSLGYLIKIGITPGTTYALLFTSIAPPNYDEYSIATENGLIMITGKSIDSVTKIFTLTIDCGNYKVTNAEYTGTGPQQNQYYNYSVKLNVPLS